MCCVYSPCRDEKDSTCNRPSDHARETTAANHCEARVDDVSHATRPWAVDDGIDVSKTSAYTPVVCASECDWRLHPFVGCTEVRLLRRSICWFKKWPWRKGNLDFFYYIRGKYDSSSTTFICCWIKQLYIFMLANWDEECVYFSPSGRIERISLLSSPTHPRWSEKK